MRPVAGVGVPLAFEQQKELLTLLHKLQLEREEKALEREQAIRASQFPVEIERPE